MPLSFVDNIITYFRHDYSSRRAINTSTNINNLHSISRQHLILHIFHFLFHAPRRESLLVKMDSMAPSRRLRDRRQLVSRLLCHEMLTFSCRWRVVYVLTSQCNLLSLTHHLMCFSLCLLRNPVVGELEELIPCYRICCVSRFFYQMVSYVVGIILLIRIPHFLW